jgi:hypothetical protein
MWNTSIAHDYTRGIGQKIRERLLSAPEKEGKEVVIAFPVLNGLHHDYRCAA